MKGSAAPARNVTVNCPQCGTTQNWDRNNPYRPFCSERCKLIDLGQWASGSYRIPTDVDHSSSSDETDP